MCNIASSICLFGNKTLLLLLIPQLILIDPDPTVQIQPTPNSNQPFAGYDITLSCFIIVNSSDIFDQVTVAATWFKDGIECGINLDSRLSLTPVALNGDGIYLTNLHLTSLNSKDSGNYQCKAVVTGPSGYSLANATNSTYLEVEGT